MALQSDDSNFREFLPDLAQPRFQIAAQQNAHTYAAAFKRDHSPPWLFNLTQAWKQLLEESFTGVTSDGRPDGNVREHLFQEEDHGIDIEEIVHAAEELIRQLDSREKDALTYPINAREWRVWSNPEILLRDLGLRLDEVSSSVAQAVLQLIGATLSPEGYRKALSAMRINDFLGQLCRLPKIMNKLSYNFLIFGNPSATEAWGWSLYGHHLCISCFLQGQHVVISPAFTGAEPNVIDAGEWAGTTILQEEGRVGLELMQGLDESKQSKACIYHLLRDPQMKQTGDLITDRWNQDDQRHLCGAFRDNRVVPYEGQVVSEMSAQQQELVLDIIEQFLLYLPAAARSARKQQAKEHFAETYFSWIGEWGDKDPFYFRIQSPVVICEFDHHSGVFLSNSEPAKFHTHTILRTPNAGDYGQALRASADKLK